MVDHLAGGNALVAADRLQAVDGEVARKDGEAPEQQGLSFIELLVAPVDCRPQRLMAGKGRAATTRQEPEAVLETFQDLRHRHHVDTDSGKFDGKWDAVKSPADQVG